MAELESEVHVELQGLPHTVSDELVTLYFENQRRSGGGPLQGWQRIDSGGILTFQKPEDAQRVLAQSSHLLLGTDVRVVPCPPRAPQRLLLQGLRSGTAPELLELYVESLLSTEGQCQVLASPRPDRVLVQLSNPLSEAEFEELAVKCSKKTVNGTAVSLAWVPHTRAVRIVKKDQFPDPILLQLYLENERRSGGGVLEGLRTLPRAQGTVATFQHWKVAERVLSQKHQLSDSELNIVPHYNVLDPDPELEPVLDSEPEPEDREIISKETPGEKFKETFDKLVPLEKWESTPAAERPVKSQIGAVTLEKVEATVTRDSPEESVPMERPGATEPLGGTVVEEAVPMERSRETMGDTVPMKVVTGEREEDMFKAEMPSEILLPMEPGAFRFLQFYYQEFLASLEDVTLHSLDGSDVAGFRISGALKSCQAAEDFLKSLLGSIGCHRIPLKHPGSIRFLLGNEGQGLLKDLEAQFHCIFEAELPIVAEPDPTEFLESPEVWNPNFLPCSSTDQDTSATQIEKIRNFLDMLKGADGEEWIPQEEEELHELEEGVKAPKEASMKLEEEAALQLALYKSLEENDQKVRETRALKQALMLSLLEDRGTNGSNSSVTSGSLTVHLAFEQDSGELSQALETALKERLREERVKDVDQDLPPAFWSCLEQRHGVKVTLQGSCAILSGYDSQPTSAADQLRRLLTVPLSQSHTLASDSDSIKGPPPSSLHTSPVVPQVMKEQTPHLESLEESSEEFQEIVRDFYSTLDNFYIRVIKVQRVLQPLLQSQYELQKNKLLQTCSQHPVERILYHGTSWQAVPDICSHGFNRSFCGRNATLYGQGVYFAVKAKVSISDRYSPPDANGHKAVFVARVLTGDYGPGHRELRVPPKRETGQSTQRYDSAVDSTRKPKLFVIFHDTQALPIFLITCQHTPGPWRLKLPLRQLPPYDS